MTKRTSPPDDARREVGAGAAVESRSVVQAVEARAADEEAPKIGGYGSLFDVRTTIGFWFQFDEEVAPEAWDKTLAESPDVRSMFNHDANWLLGRTAAESLRLATDDVGLDYEVDINTEDSDAMSVYAKVSRGDVSGSSVWFRVVREEWTEPTDDNGLERPLRRILEAQLFETGPVVFPAFPETTVAARSIDALDRVLTGLGVDSRSRRSRLVSDVLADPTSMTNELRSILEAQPDLRAAVCACDSRAGDEPPGNPGTPLTRHVHDPEFLRRRAAATAARFGLIPKEKING